MAQVNLLAMMDSVSLLMNDATRSQTAGDAEYGQIRFCALTQTFDCGRSISLWKLEVQRGWL